jgi:hypothetical protein
MTLLEVIPPVLRSLRFLRGSLQSSCKASLTLLEPTQCPFVALSLPVFPLDLKTNSTCRDRFSPDMHLRPTTPSFFRLSKGRGCGEKNQGPWDILEGP